MSSHFRHLVHTGFWVLALVPLGAFAYEAKIKLVASNAHVLPIEQRVEILEIADRLTVRPEAPVDTSLLAGVDPFNFKAEDDANAAPEKSGGTIQRKAIRFSDSALLSRVEEQLSGLIVGSMSRGERNYLQLRNGKLIEENSSFNMRLADVPQDAPISVTIGKVSRRDYELSINDTKILAAMPGHETTGTEMVQRTEVPSETEQPIQ